MKIREILNEDLSNWSGRWIHYSREPYLKINPKPYHSDPAGIYFFPEEFNTEGNWHNYLYKFIVTVKPEAKILDLAKISQDELEQIIKESGLYEKYKEYTEQYPPKDMHKRVDMAWEILSRHYAYENGKGKLSGQFNKLFRSFGYDAIFDDTKSIYVSESQLIVLNPKIIKIVDIQKRSGSGFKELKEIFNMVIELGKKYGDVTIEEPRKQKDGWNKKKLYGVIRIKNPKNENNYVSIRVDVDDPEVMPNLVLNPPSKIRVYVQYSNPQLGYGCGATYDIAKNKFEDRDGLDDIKKALEKTLAH